MKQFLIGLAAITATVVIGVLAFVLYENSYELRAYKRAVFGAREDYATLQRQYDDLKQQNKSLRKVVISSKDSDSKNTQIADIINNYGSEVDGDLSIYYKNLTSGESVIIDEDRKYYMASLYKVLLTLYLLDKVKNGQLSLTDKVGTTSATLEFALDKIITESNNEYSQILALEYGWKTIETQMKEKLGIEFSFSEGLETSVKSIGLLFEDIALSLKVTSSESNYLLSLLKDQTKTSKLPKYLPDNTYSHNKTGEFEEYSHDAGIFYTPKANYVLVFMSKTKVPADTNEQMALMSKEIYQTLNEVVK
ncbi:serine hydrolase [Candidatus Roizmanbacteria bacterium]|nr:serine hydrolase [Candidatus Roizmanbacteria bacterium]